MFYSLYYHNLLFHTNGLFQISSTLDKPTLSTCTYDTIVLLVSIVDWLVIDIDCCHNWLILYCWKLWNICNSDIFLYKDLAYICKIRIFELDDLSDLSNSYILIFIVVTIHFHSYTYKKILLELFLTFGNSDKICCSWSSMSINSAITPKQ